MMPKSPPPPLQAAAARYATQWDTDDANKRLFEAFAIRAVGDEFHRRAVWLCVLAAHKVLYGWAALECEGDEPAQALEAVEKWARTGVPPRNWSSFSRPAQAVRGGRVINDCDICRAKPIASAAAHTAQFALSGSPADAAEVLSDVWCAMDEGIHWPNAMRFEEWIATVALPAAWELRHLSQLELRS